MKINTLYLKKWSQNVKYLENQSYEYLNRYDLELYYKDYFSLSKPRVYKHIRPGIVNKVYFSKIKAKSI